MNENVTVQRKSIEEVIEYIESIDCQFFACPGPDVEPVDMATCVRCRAIQDLRKLLE